MVTHSLAPLEFFDTVTVVAACPFGTDAADRAVEIGPYKEWGDTRISGQDLLTTLR